VIHIEGMGVLGSILAVRLEAAGIDFTWDDCEHEITAWKASTSIVYPSGEPEDMFGYMRWQDWADHQTFGRFTERVPYAFTTKKPPHKGKYSYEALESEPWKVANSAWAYCVNVQEFIRWARWNYAGLRVHNHGAPAGSRVIVAHGTGNNPRRKQYVWGWAQRVMLRYPFRERFPRCALYHRKGRFVMAYAYPIANTSYWWAGSSLIVQKGEAKELDALKHFQKWERTMAEQGVFVVDDANEPPVQGWRPRGDDINDTAWVREIDGQLVVRPLWHSGVRWAPQLTDAVLEAL
jgi:hypothetical protein